MSSTADPMSLSPITRCPGFGALAALQILRSLGNHPPLIVFTGAVCDETVVSCMREGAADYLLKDRLTRLGPAVANALQLRREREQGHLANAMQYLTDGVLIVDASFRVITINKTFTVMTGHEAVDVQGQLLGAVIGGSVDIEWEPDLRAQVLAGGLHREVTLRRKNGDCIPALLSLNPIHSEYAENEYYSAVLTELSSLRKFENRIEYLSRHDALTGLPNRAALELELHKRIGAPNMTTLLLVELDDFKAVNDTLCHRTGDLLISAVAERLNQLKLPDFVLARLGGDEFTFEFTLLKPGRPSTALPFAERLRQELARPFMIEGQELFITASIGVSCYPRDGRDFDSLLRAAVAAGYQAKHRGVAVPGRGVRCS